MRSIRMRYAQIENMYNIGYMRSITYALCVKIGTKCIEVPISSLPLGEPCRGEPFPWEPCRGGALPLGALPWGSPTLGSPVVGEPYPTLGEPCRGGNLSSTCDMEKIKLQRWGPRSGPIAPLTNFKIQYLQKYS